MLGKGFFFELKNNLKHKKTLLLHAYFDAIARAVIALGHSLDMKVVAEGVETLKQ